jgi:hypothetical protein
MADYHPRPITDNAFDQQIDARTAYLATFEYLRAHYERGPWEEVGDLLTMLSLTSDGLSADPAVLDDWLAGLARVQSCIADGGYNDINLKLEK